SHSSKRALFEGERTVTVSPGAETLRETACLIVRKGLCSEPLLLSLPEVETKNSAARLGKDAPRRANAAAAASGRMEYSLREGFVAESPAGNRTGTRTERGRNR